jgi:glycosyltransferase involved in cell wall biosynthesis
MISIIIPTYNRAHFIANAIQSIIHQTYQEWELIIVNDGSTDNTEDVVNPYLKDKRIRYFKKENTGAAHSRNVGVLLAKHKWISFLDSDDEAKPNWLLTISSFMYDENVAMICNGCEYLDENKVIIKKSLPESSPIFRNVKFKMTNGGSFTVRKSLFLQIKGYVDTLQSNQHTELSYRLIPCIINQSIVSINECLIIINIHKGDRIRTNWNAVYNGTKYLIKNHYNLIKHDTTRISDYYAICANAAFRLYKSKSKVLYYQYQSIRYRPFYVKGYLRFLRYIFWLKKQ